MYICRSRAEGARAWGPRGPMGPQHKKSFFVVDPEPRAQGLWGPRGTRVPLIEIIYLNIYI